MCGSKAVRFGDVGSATRVLYGTGVNPVSVRCMCHAEIYELRWRLGQARGLSTMNRYVHNLEEVV